MLCTKHNGVVELLSLQFEKRAQWFVQSVPEKENDWADYIRGATRMLGRKYILHMGLSGVVEGTIPIGQHLPVLIFFHSKLLCFEKFFILFLGNCQTAGFSRTR